MEKSSKIYIAGHNGMVGSAIHRKLVEKGYRNFILRTVEELDLTWQKEVEDFFKTEQPEYVIDAAARVGGILANNTYRAQFIYENLMIQNNIIHNAYVYGVKKLLFLGSSCIYPKNAPQPLKEEYLLTGELEYTNEPYAIAKIAGIKMCESYNKQYGCNFISVMPTNLYGPNDNYDPETSHVLPAMIRKMHLARCLESGDWKAIRSDLDQRPVEGITGQSSDDDIKRVLKKYGINYELRITNYENSPANYPPPQRGEDTSRVTISLWGTGNVFREFLHVDDMADACVFVMEQVDAPVGSQQSAVGSQQSAVGSRQSAVGSQQSAVGSRQSEVGSQQSAVGSRQSAVGSQQSAVSSRQSAIGKQGTEDCRLQTADYFLNIGTGQDLMIRELAEMIKKTVGFKGEIKWDSTKPDGTYKKQLDVSRLHGVGWKEKISLEDGIRSVYSNYINQK